MRLIKPFLFVLLLLSGPAWAMPGDVDPTFVYPVPAVLEPDSTDLVPMPEGWMVVKAHLPAAPATTSTVELTRIDDDGRPVASFGSNGHVVTQLPGPFNVSLAAASTSDGGFLVAGYKRLNDTDDTVAAVVKLNAQGQVDLTFANDGIVEIDSSFALDRVGAIQQLEDGRIALLTWARVAAPAWDCASDRTALWYVSEDGRQRQEVHAIAKDSYASVSCRTVLTLQAGRDDQDRYRILYGNEVGIFEGTIALVPWTYRYGPFASHSEYPLIYTRMSGPGIELLGGPTPPAIPRSYDTLGKVGGFGDQPISWSGMALDLVDRAAYVGVSTDGGRVAIARITWTGSLDSGWGGGDGVAVIEGAGRVASPVTLEGIANDVRLLQVRGNGLVVATADGVIRRLETGSADSSGAFVLRPPLDPVGRINRARSFSVVVERAGSSSGVATVQYAIKEADCEIGQCSPYWEQARGGEDFVATSGTLRWEDGDSSDKTILIDLLPTTTQSYELLVAELSNPSEGARIITDWVHIFLDQGVALPQTEPGSGSVGRSGGGGATGRSLLLLLLLGAVAASRNRCRLTLGRIGRQDPHPACGRPLPLKRAR